MVENKVVYFPSSDLFYGMGLEKISKMTIPDFSDVDINDAIEFYQIHRYFLNNTRSKEWTDVQYEEYKKKSEILYGLAHRFFHLLTDDNILFEFEKLTDYYNSAFWDMFECDKLYKTISEEVFAELIKGDHVPIYDIFGKPCIVNAYGKTLKQYIVDNEWCIDLLIEYYEQEYTANEKIYLPRELSGEDVVALLGKYIDGAHVNINTLTSIYYMVPTKEFPIPDKLRLKAKKKYASESEKMNKQGVQFQHDIEMVFSEDQEAEKDVKYNKTKCMLSYSIKWLKETLDYPSILNNFIYIFEYADVPQMRATHVSVSSCGGTLEKALRKKSSRLYPDYNCFKYVDSIAMGQMEMYCQFLNENGIRIEDVLQWFFTEYLQKEFECPEIRVSFPSKNMSALEKCQCICDSLEIVLKQYIAYVKDGEIDFDLLSLSTDSVKYDLIPSLINNKYVYGTGDNYHTLVRLLFSDQSPLLYAPKINKRGDKYKCLYEMIKNEDISTEDFKGRYDTELNYLQKYGLLSCDENNHYHLKDNIKLIILKDLYNHDVISRCHYSEQAQPIIKEWVDMGILTTASTLLSMTESNYFSYMLNHEKYCNGLDLRNKYAHGKGQIIDDVKEHQYNYNVMLRLTVILAIKINDEFCLREKQRIKENENA